MEKSPLLGGKEDVEVNITGSGKTLWVDLEDSCEDDLDEGSSSFGDTGSGAENASCFSDPEVEAPMHDDCCESLQRSSKRKMTVHWRKFIRPLTWRCKWIELKLMQLQSQAHKYEKELEDYEYTKQLDFAHLKLDGSDIKSVPISGRMHRNKAKRRNKRRRVEENCDLASYMSNHSLFSYHERTDCTVDACLKDVGGVAVDIGGNNDDHEELKLNDMRTSVNHDNVDKTLDEIIQKIEAMVSQVKKIKTKLNKVISENPDRFARSSSKLQPEFHMEDLLNMPGNASPSLQVINPLIETTNRPKLDDPWEDTKDRVLTQKQTSKEDLHDLDIDGNGLVEKIGVKVSEPDSAENAMHNVNSTLKSCLNVPRNKRKERTKSDSKKWNCIQ